MLGFHGGNRVRLPQAAASTSHVNGVWSLDDVKTISLLGKSPLRQSWWLAQQCPRSHSCKSAMGEPAGCSTARHGSSARVLSALLIEASSSSHDSGDLFQALTVTFTSHCPSLARRSSHTSFHRCSNTSGPLYLRTFAHVDSSAPTPTLLDLPLVLSSKTKTKQVS